MSGWGGRKRQKWEQIRQGAVGDVWVKETCNVSGTAANAAQSSLCAITSRTCASPEFTFGLSPGCGGVQGEVRVRSGNSTQKGEGWEGREWAGRGRIGEGRAADGKAG